MRIRSKLEAPSARGTDDRSASSSVSIAMATYNGERYLREQLDSLANQDFLPMELVITDDGSSDATVSIVRAFSERSQFPVRIHQNEQRLGYADNFLKAASLCRGDLIAFCDQDDFWKPSKLRTCARYFSQDPGLSLVVHSALIWDGTKDLGKLFPCFPVTRLMRRGSADPYMLVPGFAQVFRRELLEIADNSQRLPASYDLRQGSTMVHDSWIFFLAASVGDIILLKDRLALYRQHGGNAIGVPKQRTTADQVRLTTQTSVYGRYADYYDESAELLRRAAAASRRPFATGLWASAQRLSFKARCGRLRERIYSEGVGLGGRIHCFGEIVLLGGYMPDSAKMRPGPRSAIKDLFWGVLRGHLVMKAIADSF